MALDRTMPLPRNSSKILIPDVEAVVRKVLTNATPVSYRPILCELKRAASRAGTVDGYPVTPAATLEITGLLSRASRQVLDQAILLFRADSASAYPQQSVMLMVGAGGWFSTNFLLRSDNAVQAELQKSDAHFNEAVAHYDMLTSGATDDDSIQPDLGPEDRNIGQPRLPVEADNMVTVSAHRGWSKPQYLDSLPALEYLITLQEDFHNFLAMHGIQVPAN